MEKDERSQRPRSHTEGLPASKGNPEDWSDVTIDDFTVTQEINDASDLRKVLAQPQPSVLIFRGQSDRFRLQPSIERLFETPASRFSAEAYVRSEFMRRAPHYLGRLPEKEDALGWLALARHYGAPSRLLDWTRSLPVAAFFAASQVRSDEVCTIWAVDQKALKSYALRVQRDNGGQMVRCDTWEQFISHDSQFEAAFLHPDPCARPFVAALEPFETNERMIIQQGLFLAANCLDISFQHVLASTIQAADCRLHRIRIAPSARRELLLLLDGMNINEATLFPGIDGFARSLAISAEIRDRFTSEANRPLPWRPQK